VAGCGQRGDGTAEKPVLAVGGRGSPTTAGRLKNLERLWKFWRFRWFWRFRNRGAGFRWTTAPAAVRRARRRATGTVPAAAPGVPRVGPPPRGHAAGVVAGWSPPPDAAAVPGRRRRPRRVAERGAGLRARVAPRAMPPPIRRPGRALRPLHAAARPAGAEQRGPRRPGRGRHRRRLSVPSASSPAGPPRPRAYLPGRGPSDRSAIVAGVVAGCRTRAAPPGRTPARPQSPHRCSPAGPFGVPHQGDRPAPPRPGERYGQGEARRTDCAVGEDCN